MLLGFYPRMSQGSIRGSKGRLRTRFEPAVSSTKIVSREWPSNDGPPALPQNTWLKQDIEEVLATSITKDCVDSGDRLDCGLWRPFAQSRGVSRLQSLTFGGVDHADYTVDSAVPCLNVFKSLQHLPRGLCRGRTITVFK